MEPTLSVVSTAEVNDVRLLNGLHGLWVMKRPFEHVIVLNRCSENFKSTVRDMLAQSPANVTTVLVEEDIHVAQQGLEELLTSPDSEHSRLQFQKRCFTACHGTWMMLTDGEFVPTPNWIKWMDNLKLDSGGGHVAISMHSQSAEGRSLCRPKLFNFVPSFRRHYWWSVPNLSEHVLCIENKEADAYHNLAKPYLDCQPWFEGREPTLESTWSWARSLLPSNKTSKAPGQAPSNSSKEFVVETIHLFAPDGSVRDSRDLQWIDLGAAAIRAMRAGPEVAWREDPVFLRMDRVTHEEALVYWSQIKDFEFDVEDLQPICTECDYDKAVETWSDGLQASAITLKHVWHALFIMERIWDVQTVVEVGAGYGRFAKAFLLCAQLCNRPVESYTIIELPALQPLCEHYLQDFADVVNFREASLGGSDVGEMSLFISLDGVSELADKQKSTYLQTLLPRSKSVCLLWACTQIPDELYEYDATMDLFLPESSIIIYGPKC